MAGRRSAPMVSREMDWLMLDLLTVTYLFLGGAGAGAGVVLAILLSFTPDSAMGFPSGRFSPSLPYRQLFGVGYAVDAAVCLAGVLCLYLDLARPDALTVLFTSPNYNVVSMGAYSLTVLFACTTALTVVFVRNVQIPSMLVRTLVIVASIAALVVMVYTALMLQSFGHRPFFRPPSLVALFAISSLSTGSATVAISSLAFRSAHRFRLAIARMLNVDAVVIVVELAVLSIFLMANVQVAPDSVMSLIVGDFSAVFWVGLVGCGLVVPCVLECAMGRVRGLVVQPFVPAALVLVGGFLLRWCIVAAAAGGVG